MFNGTLYFDTDVDIQAKGDRSQRIFATEVDDGTG